MVGRTAHGNSEGWAQTEVDEIHLGSVTDSHERRGLFQVVQMWPEVKRLTGTFTRVPKTHNGEGGPTCWQITLTFRGAMGSRHRESESVCGGRVPVADVKDSRDGGES